MATFCLAMNNSLTPADLAAAAYLRAVLLLGPLADRDAIEAKAGEVLATWVRNPAAT